jgi:glycerophosphoryl diester phosphodiesterase
MSGQGRPLVVAHRGASADHIENTLPAFVGAREQGADWVELDVHLAADDGLVVHHDAHYADGRELLQHPGGDRPPTVPLLGDALDACAGMGVNIELKVTVADSPLPDLVVALVRTRRSLGIEQPISISSFDEAALDRVRALDPGIDTAQLVFDLSADPGVVERSAEKGAVGINPWDPFVDAELVRRCRSSGLAVTPWTVDDRGRIIELANVGVDGIITNTPGLARGYLG